MESGSLSRYLIRPFIWLNLGVNTYLKNPKETIKAVLYGGLFLLFATSPVAIARKLEASEKYFLLFSLALWLMLTAGAYLTAIKIIQQEPYSWRNFFKPLNDKRILIISVVYLTIQLFLFAPDILKYRGFIATEEIKTLLLQIILAPFPLSILFALSEEKKISVIDLMKLGISLVRKFWLPIAIYFAARRLLELYTVQAGELFPILSLIFWFFIILPIFYFSFLFLFEDLTSRKFSRF